MRILVVNGNTSDEITERVAEEARAAASPGTEIKPVKAAFGSRLILSRVDNAIAAHAVITALARHHEDCDAAVIAASPDMGLAGARELLPIPVVGMTETALLTSCMIGGMFGLIVFDRRATPVFKDLVASYGLTARMAGMYTVEMTKTDFFDPERVKTSILGAIEHLVQMDGADCVVITGATMAGVSQSLRGPSPVPLVSSITCAVRQAELLVGLDLPKPRSGSYASPPSSDPSGIDPAIARLMAGDEQGRVGKP